MRECPALTTIGGNIGTAYYQEAEEHCRTYG
jgi:hypothetical protein